MKEPVGAILVNRDDARLLLSAMTLYLDQTQEEISEKYPDARLDNILGQIQDAIET